ncbi:MAG: ABC transporter ATP-binding protein [Flavobacteriaceae bacterium]
MKSQKDNSENQIVISNLKKTFSHNNEMLEVLNIPKLIINKNEFVAIVGQSGCGKTTLLNILSGFTSFQGGVSIFGKEKITPSSNKAVVFQEDAVFPWMTVFENIGYSLKIQQISKKIREKRISQLISLVELKGAENKYPKQLSGGMKKRVDIARAVANSPDIILMDEPFGSLDYQTRKQLQQKLLHLLDSEPKTILFVTHDVNEALLLSDRIIVLPKKSHGNLKDIKITLQKNRSLDICDTPEFIQLRNNIESIITSN